MEYFLFVRIAEDNVKKIPLGIEVGMIPRGKFRLVE
jgi:hypothetical protein